MAASSVTSNPNGPCRSKTSPCPRFRHRSCTRSSYPGPATLPAPPAPAVHRPQRGHGQAREGEGPRQPVCMGARRLAAVVLETGEVDASRQPRQQLHQVGAMGRLRFAAGHQGEHIAQQSHGTPLSMMPELHQRWQAPYDVLWGPEAPRFTSLSCRMRRKARKESAQPAQNCPNHRPDDFKKIREELGLAQRQVGEILGGGTDAFAKYESGERTPSTACTNLLKILKAHPNTLDEPETAAVPSA